MAQKLNVDEIDKKYNVRPFEEASVSKNGVKPVDLDVIDLSLFKEGPEYLAQRRELADKVERSLSTYGFLSIINHGIDLEKIEKLKSIAQSVCELPEEVQLKHLAGALKSDLEDRSKSLGAERGAGFKPKKYWSMKNGVEDSIVLYNVRNMLQPAFYDLEFNNYPELVQAHLDEIADYFRNLHYEVLRKLTVLCDIVLELPENFLWDNYFKVIQNDYENSGHGFGRFMLYHPPSEEDEKKTEKNWLRGHSDATAFTFITSQPILSLQIRDYYTGEWKYVGHKPGGLIVNVGDAMEFITGGYFKSSIHRVVAPPDDQKGFRRLVIIYFCNPSNNSVLDPEPLNSAKLQRLGLGKKPVEWEKIKFSSWDEEKGRLFGKKEVNDSKEEEPNLVLMYGRLHERWHQAELNFSLEDAKKNLRL